MSFIWLIFAHYIGDTVMQSSWQAENKSKYWYVMLCHCMVYTAIVSIALQYIGILQPWMIVFIFVGHFICDEIKCHQPRERVKRYKYSRGLPGRFFCGDYYQTYDGSKVSNWWMIYPDQAWHIIQLAIVYLIK
jgi:hypothetical protein